VLPDQELECLLNYTIKLSQADVDHDCEPCIRFYRDELTVSFTKILTDDAVSSWKVNIHNNILMLCGRLLQLCSLHVKNDNFHLLELLAVTLDPENKFHNHNAARVSSFAAESCDETGTQPDFKIFSKSPQEPRQPKGWLVDLLNNFGQLGGFDNFLERMNRGLALHKKRLKEKNATSSERTIQTEKNDADNSVDTKYRLTVPIIYMLLRPFGQCQEFLTQQTIETYFQSILESLIEILNELSDEELKKDVKLEGKNDFINGIMKSMRRLISRTKNAENLSKDLEMCRLKIILRVLQISSFNGKMNALNEINKVLSYVSYYPHRPQSHSDDEIDSLSSEKLAKWIKETDVLGIVLKDSLHQPQYVEKLEKILRFLIKEKALTLEDLSAVWKAQAGKHEAIVKNVHDLLAKLAWDFNTEQLDYLFDCFQVSNFFYFP
jgi:ubiquitin carboxyl-terminal hydrolase 9/24